MLDALPRFAGGELALPLLPSRRNSGLQLVLNPLKKLALPVNGLLLLQRDACDLLFDFCQTLPLIVEPRPAKHINHSSQCGQKDCGHQ